MHLKKTTLVLALAAVLFAAGGCDALLKSFGMGGPSLPKPSAKNDDELLRRAYDAIEKDDWESFSKLCALEVDFIVLQQQLGKKEAESGKYADLRAQNLNQLRQDFEKAAAGGEDQIDFHGMQYAGAGKVLESGNRPTSAYNVFVPYRTMTIRIVIDGRETDSIEYMPAFFVADWEGKSGQPMIVGIDFRTPWVRSGIRSQDTERNLNRRIRDEYDDDDDYDSGYDSGYDGGYDSGYDDDDSGAGMPPIPAIGGERQDDEEDDY